MNMRRVPRLLLVGLAVLLVATLGWSAPPDPGNVPGGQSPPAAPGQVEVRFTNGSIVVMVLLQDQIDIATEYGKLTVPYKDIRHIEFGLHTSEEQQRKIDDAFRRLSSDVFREREAAVEDLVTLGAQAYLRLQSVTKSEDLEAARRAEAAIKKIREKVHPRVLRRTEEDVVHTAKFTIVGRLTTPTLKAKAEDFGDLELRPAKLLSIRWLDGEARKEVVIDAATYGSPGSRRWLDTGIRVDSHRGLHVTAAGRVDLWPQQPGQYMANPDGQERALGGAAMVINGRPVGFGGSGGSGGELMGRIGESGTPFVVGSRYTQIPKEAGTLYLQIAPSPWGNPSTGEYRVTITTGPFPDDGARGGND